MSAPAPMFACVLDEQPDFLVPARLLRRVERGAGELVLNAAAWPSWQHESCALPDGARNLPARFAADGHIIWIRNALGCLLPFNVASACRATIDALRAARFSPSELPERLRNALRGAEVLVPVEHADASRARWLTVATAAGAQFLREGLAPLAGLIHPYHLGALRRYLRRVLRAGELQLGDGQTPRRFVSHNEPVLRFFHEQLTGAVQEVVREPIKPSYSYLASYQEGAELPWHTDREQCEFTVTMLVDFSPEPALESLWPLYVRLPGSTVEVFQGIGDALLFSGRTLPHYRPRLHAQCTSTSVFFHYVRADFPQGLD